MYYDPKALFIKPLPKLIQEKILLLDSCNVKQLNEMALQIIDLLKALEQDKMFTSAFNYVLLKKYFIIELKYFFQKNRDSDNKSIESVLKRLERNDFFEKQKIYDNSFSNNHNSIFIKRLSKDFTLGRITENEYYRLVISALEKEPNLQNIISTLFKIPHSAYSQEIKIIFLNKTLENYLKGFKNEKIAFQDYKEVDSKFTYFTKEDIFLLDENGNNLLNRMKGIDKLFKSNFLSLLTTEELRILCLEKNKYGQCFLDKVKDEQRALIPLIILDEYEKREEAAFANENEKLFSEFQKLRFTRETKNETKELIINSLDKFDDFFTEDGSIFHHLISTKIIDETFIIKLFEEKKINLEQVEKIFTHKDFNNNNIFDIMLKKDCFNHNDLTTILEKIKSPKIISALNEEKTLNAMLSSDRFKMYSTKKQQLNEKSIKEYPEVTFNRLISFYLEPTLLTDKEVTLALKLANSNFRIQDALLHNEETIRNTSFELTEPLDFNNNDLLLKNNDYSVYLMNRFKDVLRPEVVFKCKEFFLKNIDKLDPEIRIIGASYSLDFANCAGFSDFVDSIEQKDLPAFYNVMNKLFERNIRLSDEGKEGVEGTKFRFLHLTEKLKSKFEENSILLRITVPETKIRFKFND
jgi:hypothetical protein